MKFKRYSSIEQAHRIKAVNYIYETGRHVGEWVLLLKIHGANYSLWTDGIEVKRGKRSGFVEGDVFMGDINFDYDIKVKKMFNFIKTKVATLETLTICGEIYGGMYNHPDVDKVKGATRVQKEVQYRPDNDFIVFDIKLDNYILDHDAVISLCHDFGFRHVPVLANGKFEDLMKFPVKFIDPLHSYMGLPEIEDNYAEGWVLKPVEPTFFSSGERIILKGKNPDLADNISKKDRKPTVPVYDLSDDGNVLKDELMGYINENRLRDVLSHGEIEDITNKDFGRVVGMLSQDVFMDFSKDYGVSYEKLNKKDRIIIKRCMNRASGDVIRPNFVNIIDKTF